MDREAARLAVEALQRAYVHCIDNGALEEWPGFFAEDCRYQIIPRRNLEAGQPVGFYYCDNQAMLKDRMGDRAAWSQWGFVRLAEAL